MTDKGSIFDDEYKKYDEEADDLVLLKKCFHKKDKFGAFLSVFGILIFSVLYAIPYTIIPRHNSIVHPSYWLEVLLPVYTSFLLSAGSFLLDMILFFKESSLKSIKVYFKMYFLILLVCTILYILCYTFWSVMLGLNHPMPYLAIICLLPTWGILPLGHYFILPAHLLKKDDFRRKLKIYSYYFTWFILMIAQNEVLSILFAHAPSGFQFLVVFLLAACQKFDTKIRNKMIIKMMGETNEEAMAILTIDINVLYSSFIAVRLTGAEWATVCASVLTGFILHLQLTYRIIQDFGKIKQNGTDSQNRERSIRITKLIITEAIEGLTPIVYAISMAMAFYGPNDYIFRNVGNNYMSKAMKDIGPLFRTMSILFIVDTLSVIVNSFLLWKILNVNMMSEFGKFLNKYWFLIAVPLELSMSLYLACKDVNLGIDETYSYPWISDDGREYLIYNLTDSN